MTEIRLGILGVGGFGLFCLQQYRTMPGVRVTVIGGTNPEKYARLAREYAIPHFTTDWRELVTHPDVDIVYLATPPDLHAEQGIAATRAGKHLFCEKPLALTLEDADAMLASADAHGVRLSINFVMRYSVLYDMVRRIVMGKLFGNAQHLIFQNTAGDLPEGHWFWQPDRSGDIPVEHGVHFFDIFSTILGPSAVRYAEVTQRPGGQRDKWQIVLQYAQHVVGDVYHAFDKPGILERTWSVLDCECGYLRLDGWIPERLEIDGLLNKSELERFHEIVPTATVTPLAGAEQSILANGHRREVTDRVQASVSAGEKQAIYAQAVRDAMADFIAWTLNPTYQPLVTGADGREALQIALAARAMALRNMQ